MDKNYRSYENVTEAASLISVWIKICNCSSSFVIISSSTSRTRFNIFETITSCARGDTICLRPLQVDNIFAFNHQVAPIPACWLFKTSARSFDLESGVRVTCDVGYLCANFSLPMPLYFPVRPDERDRQMSDVRQTSEKASLNAPPMGAEA